MATGAAPAQATAYARRVDTALLGRLLIALGVGVVIVGAFLALGGRLPFGRLPGDIAVTGQNGGFFFPVVSCLVLSVLITVVLNIVIRR